MALWCSRGRDNGFILTSKRYFNYQKWCLSLLWFLLLLTTIVSSLGGVISDSIEYDEYGSPYVITEDIVIKEGSIVTIRPGVTLQFDPGVGITVNGVLKAEVGIKKVLDGETRPS